MSTKPEWTGMIYMECAYDLTANLFDRRTDHTDENVMMYGKHMRDTLG